jgi:signal transduction histidine kinase
MGLACYAMISLTEVLDERLGRQSEAWDGHDPVIGAKILKRIARNTVLSASAISAFVVSLAFQQTSGGHFTPLFILFSASLFAAMNNSQMVGILLLRLSIYGCAFLFIAFLDVFRFLPPLDSHIWLEFFTIILVLYFVFDISVKFYLNYQKGLEQLELIKQENERTKAALVIKSEFVSVVSHELRTPLTSIKGSLDLIKSGRVGELSPELQPLVQMASKNSTRLAKMIDELLDLQKMESGEMAFRFEPVDVNGLVNEAVEATFGYASQLGINVTTALCDGDCWIMADRSRLDQVMQNLLSNALKFSEVGGTVKVGAEVMGRRVRISVEDEGIGIPDGAKEQVFGRFSQVDSSDTRKVGGTGLGLNISKEIIERHNATIDFVSELGKGTTFFLEFDCLENEREQGIGIDPVTKVA